MKSSFLKKNTDDGGRREMERTYRISYDLKKKQTLTSNFAIKESK